MKLNLGSGKDHRPNHVNVDIRKEVEPDMEADIRHLPYGNRVAEEVLAIDVLEHFKEPVKVLKEWYRVLKPGGILFVRVPDWDKIGDKNFWKDKEWKRTENKVLGGRRHPMDQHKSLFNKDVLEKRLKAAGFKEVEVKISDTAPLHWHLLGRAVKWQKTERRGEKQ